MTSGTLALIILIAILAQAGVAVLIALRRRRRQFRELDGRGGEPSAHSAAPASVLPSSSAEAWDISTGSHDVVVAVLGTGVDVNHPDLEANIWVNAGEIPGNEIDDDENGYVDDVHGWNFGDSSNEVNPASSEDPLDYIYDVSSHETQVAGVIAAEGDNGEGVAGVNWQCSMMVLRMSLYYPS